MLSPGVKVNEIDLSIVVPSAGGLITGFAGIFTKGPSDKLVLINNTDDLVSNFGYPTNSNYNDWFTAASYLAYADKLYVSRVVNGNGSWTKSIQTVHAINEQSKVEISKAPVAIQPGSIVKFGLDAEDEYMVKEIEYDLVLAQKQVDTITIDSAVDGDYIIQILDNEGVPTYITYTADVTNNFDTPEIIASQLGILLENYDTSATNVSVTDNVITVTASIAGVPLNMSVYQGNMTVANVQENIEADFYELVFEEDIDFNDVTSVGAEIYIKDSAYNAIAEVQKAGSIAPTAAELVPYRLHIANEFDYEVQEMSIPVTENSRLKLIAKSSGSLMNGLEVAIARQADFDTGTSQVFNGIPLNDLFETKPLESNKEIAVVVRFDGQIVSRDIVSLVPGKKDFRNKSIYIEDVFNTYNEYIYVKDNTLITDMPESRIFSTNGIVVLSNGSDGAPTLGDYENAHGDVANGTLFGDTEMLDLDLIIANEAARLAAARIATDRKDCVAFIGAKFEHTVGLKSAKIVENLVNDVMTGELNNGYSANSYNAFFGNYGRIYDKYNDKYRWIGLQGHAAGLKAQTTADLATWWTAAGLNRGKIKGVDKLAFIPSKGQMDILYKNKCNPITSFPGEGIVLYGQKTLQNKASSFDRLNVRFLFNFLERMISKMAKYFLFEFNDVFTRQRFVSIVSPFLNQVKTGRGLYDFYIRCDETNNTPYIIDTNQFIADIAIQPARSAEFITLNFIATPTGVDFKTIFS